MYTGQRPASRVTHSCPCYPVAGSSARYATPCTKEHARVRANSAASQTLVWLDLSRRMIISPHPVSSLTDFGPTPNMILGTAKEDQGTTQEQYRSVCAYTLYIWVAANSLV